MLSLRTFVFSLVVAAAALGARAYNAVRVSMADGSEQYVELSTELTMRVTADAVQFVSPEAEVSFPMADVDTYRFANHTFDALTDIAPDGEMSIEGGVVRLSQPGELYGADGRRVASGKEISLAGLRAGVYVLTIGATVRSAKIAVK